MEKEKLKCKLHAIPERFGGGYKAKMCARKRKWASGPARLGGQVSTSPLPTYLQLTKKLGNLQVIFALRQPRAFAKMQNISSWGLSI